VQSLLVNDAAWRALEPACARLAPDVTAFVCETQDFAPLTGYDFHRGCLALVSRPAPIALDALIGSAAGVRSFVLLEDVANVDNVGGIFRNAAAFGVDGILLSDGCGDPLYRKAIRTSMAATLRVPFATATSGGGWTTALTTLRAHGFQIVALTPREPAVTLDVFARQPRAERIAWLVGAEGPGLTSETDALADVRVRIPISDAVDSLNVAVATGIALAATHRLVRK
jgi:tRNA G18 (ribose-2'-O)-methylase SpoU